MMKLYWQGTHSLALQASLPAPSSWGCWFANSCSPIARGLLCYTLLSRGSNPTILHNLKTIAKLIISWKHKLVTYSINGKSLLLPTSQNKRPCFATGIFCRCLVEVFFDRFLPSIGTACFDSKIKSVTVAQTNHLVLPKTFQKPLFFQAKSYISFLLLLVYHYRSLNFGWLHICCFGPARR